MGDYMCQNSNCGETWDTNNQGGLMPGAIDSGYWEHLSESDNCPACDEDIYEGSEDWQWIRSIK